MKLIERGLLMPGLGSQYVTMGKELYDRHRVVQECFEEAADCLGVNFVKLIFAASDVEIQSFEQGPLALFVIQAASAALLQEAQIPLSAAAGLDVVSFYSALYAARSLSLPDGLYLLKKLSEIAQPLALDPTVVYAQIPALRPDVLDMVAALCEQSRERGARVEIVRVDAEYIFVSGVHAGIAYLEEKLVSGDVVLARRSTGDVSMGLLTPELVAQFVPYFEKIDIKEPTFPLLNVRTGEYVATAEHLKNTLQESLLYPVRADVLMSQISAWLEGVVAIPSQKVYEKLLLSTSQVAWYTMETEAAWQTLVQHAAPPEIFEELQKTSAESMIDSDDVLKE